MLKRLIASDIPLLQRGSLPPKHKSKHCTGDGVIRISPVLNNCQRDIMSQEKGIK